MKSNSVSESQFFAKFSQGDRGAILDAEESHHAAKVFRHRVGDILRVGNGSGLTTIGRILEISTQQATLEFIEPVALAIQPRVHLAIACLKDNDLEEVMETCGQLPLASMTLLRTDHSQEPRESDLGRCVRRLELKSMVASKQALKPWITSVLSPKPFSSWLAGCTHDLILCDIEGKAQLENGILQNSNPLTLLIGPEGGFSANEILAIKQRGASLLSLGTTRLRAKTCPVVAMGALLGMNCLL